METQKPIKTFTDSNVSASVWRKEVQKNNETIPIYDVSISQGYYDQKEKKTKFGTNISAQNVLRVALLLQHCHDFINHSKKMDSKAKREKSKQQTDDDVSYEDAYY